MKRLQAGHACWGDYVCIPDQLFISQKGRENCPAISVCQNPYKDSPQAVRRQLRTSSSGYHPVFTFGLPTVVGWLDHKVAGESIIMMLKVSLLISGLGMLLLFPGAVYVVTDPAVTNNAWLTRFGIITVILWSLLTSVYVPSFFPVLADKTMALAGVSDWETRRFQIDNATIPASHFSNDEWHRAWTVGKKLQREGDYGLFTQQR